MEKVDAFILYRETAGAGDDEESNKPNGIAVTLAHFDGVDYRSPAHYVLTNVVVINHEIVVSESELIKDRRYQADARMLRKAIALFDQLVELNPEVKEEAKETL